MHVLRLYQKGRQIMRRSYLVALMLVLTLAGGMASCQSMQFGREAGKAAVTPTTLPLEVKPEELFTQTEEVEVCGAAVRIDSVERRPNEREGKDLVLITVTVRNDEEKTAPINQLDFYLFDSEGTVNAVAIVSLDNMLRSPRLEKGEVASGILPYFVPAGDTSLKLNWSPGWCADRAIFELVQAKP
jgi:hypothetical protein